MSECIKHSKDVNFFMNPDGFILPANKNRKDILGDE